HRPLLACGGVRRDAVRWIVVASAAFVAGCGDAAAPAPLPRTAETAAAPTPRPQPAPPGLTPAQVDALVEAWKNVSEDDEEGRDAAELRLLEAGTPAAERIVALFVSIEYDHEGGEDGLVLISRFWLLLPRF